MRSPLIACTLAAFPALTAGQTSAPVVQVGDTVATFSDGGVWLNNDVVLRLQVDDNPEPIRELRRLVEIAARQRERLRR